MCLKVIMTVITAGFLLYDLSSDYTDKYPVSRWLSCHYHLLPDFGLLPLLSASSFSGGGGGAYLFSYDNLVTAYASYG